MAFAKGLKIADISADGLKLNPLTPAEVLTAISDDGSKLKSGVISAVIRNVLSTPMTVADLIAMNSLVTGTSGTKLNLTDGDVGTACEFGANQYVIMPLGRVYEITQWRQRTSSGNVGDGEFNLDYWDGTQWVTWVTFPTVSADDWTSWSAESPVSTNKLRLISTVLDSHSTSMVMELEVKY